MVGLIKWGARALIAAVVLAAIGAGVLYVFISQRLSATPEISGSFTTAGLSGPVVIARDDIGAPHIFASSDRDVHFALGFAHAQDRFFQMDLVRRSVHGRLAEVLGPPLVRMDARARLMGHPDMAQMLLDRLDPNARAIVDAYVAGVNAALESEAFATPPQYTVLQAKPEPWRAVDTAAVWASITITLGVGQVNDALRARLKNVLTPDQIDEFLDGDRDFAPTILGADDIPQPNGPAGRPGGGQIEGPQPGSNAWTTSGDLTSRGRPMLANDPHLELTTPGVWYLARMEFSTGPVAGGTLPGSPMVIIGRNANAAWGFTAGTVDTEDLIEVSPSELSLSPEQTIRVKGAADVTVTPLQALGGRIADPEYFNVDQYEGPVALVRAGDGQWDSGFNLYIALNASRPFAEIDAAADMVTAPVMNFHYAEAGAAPEDDITAYRLIGRVPIRDRDGGWTGRFIPPQAMPRAVNPADGVLISANNPIAPEGAPWAFAGPYEVYRPIRAEELVSATRLHDLDTFQRAQIDVVSPLARRLSVAMGRAEPQTDGGRILLTLFEGWNGTMDADATAPLIFALWMEALPRYLWADELGEETFEDFDYPRGAFIDQVLNGALSHWCDDVTTPGVRERCSEILGLALEDAAAALIGGYGEDPGDWLWGDAHVTAFDPPVLSRVPVFGDDLVKTVRTPGSPHTLSAAAYVPRGLVFDVNFGAGMRTVFDLADLDDARFMIAPGQSGMPGSDHFDDLAEPWAEGRYVQLRADWPLGQPQDADSLELWVTENAPPGVRVLALSPR